MVSKTTTAEPKDNSEFQMETHINEPADFETVVKAAGFGRFNYLLLLVACPSVMATIIETSSVAYILPSAECDLRLDLVDKGILNAITYCGMITSAFVWGYLADTRGRQKLLMSGFLLNVICTTGSTLSQNFIQLMVSKFFGGLVMCGPFAIVMSYLSEFHGSKHRERIIMYIGILFTLANILMPIVAMGILPNTWNINILNMNFTPWKLFLAICGVPSLLSGLLICLFPESPRFLMSQGRNAEALKVFKHIYAINTGKPKENFPIKELINELAPEPKDYSKVVTVSTIEVATPINNGSPSSSIDLANSDNVDAKQHSPFRALCFKPYLSLSLLVYLMNFFILFGQITMRLWLPQIFASLHEYEQISSGTTSMCTILEYSVNKTQLMKNPLPDNECVVVITPSTYINNIIVAVANLIAMLVAGSLVNWLGQKRIQVIGLTVAGTCGIALYWSSSAVTTLIITSLYICMGSVASTTAIGTSVNLFPTSLRTMIVSLSLMFGRIGCIMGNILFPVFMSFGCISPFLMLGSVMFIGCILGSCLPSTKNKALK